MNKQKTLKEYKSIFSDISEEEMNLRLKTFNEHFNLITKLNSKNFKSIYIKYDVNMSDFEGRDILSICEVIDFMFLDKYEEFDECYRKGFSKGVIKDIKNRINNQLIN